MQSREHSLAGLRGRKRRVYSVLIGLALIAVLLSWLSLPEQGERSLMQSYALPVFTAIFLLLGILLWRKAHLGAFETGLFIVTALPLLLRFTEIIRAEMIATDSLGTLMFWFPFVYVIGFLALREPVDVLVLGAFTALTILIGFSRHFLPGHLMTTRDETLILLRFSVSNVAFLVITFAIFRFNEENARLRANAQSWERQARTDSLTQTYNRLALSTELDRELKRKQRYGRHTSLLMFDVDQFKNINDRFGHLVGDEVLVKIAEVLKEQLRETDIISRWGGDEFVAILPETDLEAAHEVAERLRRNIQAIVVNGGENPAVSIGVIELEEGQSIEDAFKEVDRRLYHSKFARKAT